MNVGSLYLQFQIRFMGRPEKCRKICSPPRMSGFRPFGIAHCTSGNVILKFEEFESIRLANYENMSQDDAARNMNVSRPTFTRIYNRALKQIAKSFVEGKTLSIGGGNYTMDTEWFRCRKCFRLIEGLENHSKCGNCKDYGMEELLNLNTNVNN